MVESFRWMGKESQPRAIDMGEACKGKNDLAGGCRFRLRHRALKGMSGLKVKFI